MSFSAVLVDGIFHAKCFYPEAANEILPSKYLSSNETVSVSWFQILDEAVSLNGMEKGMNPYCSLPQLRVNNRTDQVLYSWYDNQSERRKPLNSDQLYST